VTAHKRIRELEALSVKDDIEIQITELARRYHEKFPNAGSLPTMFWHGTEAQLDALCEAAIARGSPVTIEDMLRAQGLKPLPPDAVWF
jgi:hypothetical protein